MSHLHLVRGRDTLRTLPVLLRHAVVGAACLGLLGSVVGLVLGLRAYPPTAVVAVVEVGFPSSVLGALLGLGTGAVAALREHVGRPR